MIYIFFFIMLFIIAVTVFILNSLYKNYKRVAYDRHKSKVSELYQWYEDMKLLKKKDQIDIVLEALEKHEHMEMKRSD
ncbi:hypothetical protein OSX66_09895 [Staphylococcus agnetis]|uniref:hypothetical protein n=1 Tax=Staphylococcus agnetis TaxID=985762 RepID=UPI002418437A|nr:hypothetical protein [Staphylococcus agnetis]MDG4944209.1 hypothetical protein [Staphylococcus agnetis]